MAKDRPSHEETLQYVNKRWGNVLKALAQKDNRTMTKFTLYWRNGEKQIVEGPNIADAMTIAGYSAGALRALDFYKKGIRGNFVWNEQAREWKEKD